MHYQACDVFFAQNIYTVTNAKHFITVVRKVEEKFILEEQLCMSVVKFGF